MSSVAALNEEGKRFKSVDECKLVDSIKKTTFSDEQDF